MPTCRPVASPVPLIPKKVASAPTGTSRTAGSLRVTRSAAFITKSTTPSAGRAASCIWSVTVSLCVAGSSVTAIVCFTRPSTGAGGGLTRAAATTAAAQAAARSRTKDAALLTGASSNCSAPPRAAASRVRSPVVVGARRPRGIRSARRPRSARRCIAPRQPRAGRLQLAVGPARRLQVAGCLARPATGGKRFGVSSQTRSQALGTSRVERDHARESDPRDPGGQRQATAEERVCRAAARSPASGAPAPGRRVRNSDHGAHDDRRPSRRARRTPQGLPLSIECRTRSRTRAGPGSRTG